VSNNQFVHLHLHTQYSLLDGANKLPDILVQAHAKGQTAIAMTDHGTLHGAIEFYLEAKKIGIKPIIGCELYVNPVSRFERTMKTQGGAGTHHLTVLAKDLEGYRNLCRLVSLSYKEGFYFKPRVDHELLEKYNKGLIVLSGCLAGELSEEISIDNIKKAREVAEFYATTFKDRYFLELQPHGIQEQKKLNSGCIELAKDMGIPLVATTDCHYPHEEDHYAQEVLMCISTGKTINDPTRMRHEGVRLHLKTAEEMHKEFNGTSNAAEAIKNSCMIADMCNLDLDFSKYYMPVFKGDKKPIDLMAEKARLGLERRYEQFAERKGAISEALKKSYKERLEFEIEMIGRMGFADYFLVVSDFIVWAKEQSIPVGPGRGSVAGSLVAYALRITEVDPIEHKLLFERFLNPDRISLPDIDVDFCIQGRDKVIAYVVAKYGKENVAQIATFGTLKAKAAIKDVGRALGISYAETDRIAQLVPAPRQGFDYSLTEAIKMEKRLADYAKAEGKELISLALKLEGLTRHSSTHAAGVVIGDRPLMELLPMMVDKDGNDVTQYSMSYVEKCGLVKFDFLGLKTLTVIHAALKIIKDSREIILDLEALPLDDAKTYSLLCAGNTTGVFQLESTGITDMTMRLKPSCFDDLVAILSLYRPGPLDAGMVDHYIDRKHGREKISYEHPLMKNILADTYGIIVYQEQIMQIARELAGYSLAEADLLRKAMGKKDPEEMAKQKTRFLSGAKDKSIDNKLAQEIFNQMETFARYGFNRSHSAAYAMISYQTAYLKAHYPVEFMAALMSLEMEDSDKTLKNFNECRKQKIKVLPPDVNQSVAGFSVRGGEIRYGLEAVKGVGEKVVQYILSVRDEGGDFKDFNEFLSRIDLKQVNKRVLENFIKSGGFDFSGHTRREMFEGMEENLKLAQNRQKDKDSNQISLFGAVDASSPVFKKDKSNLPEWPVNQKLSFEREALGFYISGHPLEKFQVDLKRWGARTTEDIKASGKQSSVRLAGVVTALKLKNTKKGDRYASFVLEDWLGTLEALIWPDTYKNVMHFLAAEDPVMVTGRLDVSEERCTLIVEKMESLISLRDRSATQGLITLLEKDGLENRIDQLLDIFKMHSGPCPVKVKLNTSDAEVFLVLRDKKDAPVCVVPSELLCEAVEQVFGRPVLSFF
jgi:DNA polymerase-3 subunit alpha